MTHTHTPAHTHTHTHTHAHTHRQRDRHTHILIIGGVQCSPCPLLRVFWPEVNSQRNSGEKRSRLDWDLYSLEKDREMGGQREGGRERWRERERTNERGMERRREEAEGVRKRE